MAVVLSMGVLRLCILAVSSVALHFLPFDRPATQKDALISALQAESWANSRRGSQ